MIYREEPAVGSQRRAPRDDSQEAQPRFDDGQIHAELSHTAWRASRCVDWSTMAALSTPSLSPEQLVPLVGRHAALCSVTDRGL